MIVGTCASRPAPTTSPMALLSMAVLSKAVPPLSRVHRVFRVAVEVEAPGTAFAADARQPGPAERRPQVPDEEAVDPHGPGGDPGRDSFGPGLVAGEHRRGQAVAGVVGQRHGLVFAIEGLQR